RLRILHGVHLLRNLQHPFAQVDHPLSKGGRNAGHFRTRTCRGKGIGPFGRALRFVCVTAAGKEKRSRKKEGKRKKNEPCGKIHGNGFEKIAATPLYGQDVADQSSTASFRRLFSSCA